MPSDKDKDRVTISGSDNVISFNQSGGVTAGTYINQAPEPELRLISNEGKANPDGTYTSSVLTEVVAPYTPGKLIVEAFAPGIVDLDVRPQGTGVMMGGHAGKRAGLCFATVINPSGRYWLNIKTKDEPQLSVEWRFE